MRLRSQIVTLTTVLATMSLYGAITGPVSVTGGKISGVPGKDPAITAFKGIPFAAPPVDNLRWRAPSPVVPWQGIRQASDFGNSCMQLIVTERKPWTYEFMAHGPISEDCLYLNVWTPAKSSSEKRPVYVYIYGGGNVEGSSSVTGYDGEGLARKGILVVTLNYRLGILGFFTHPELTKETEYHGSGNYATLDLIAGLRWVHDNIAAFGGDPAKVTIGGQSAGAGNSHILTASPLAKGLFRGAIMESGSTVNTGANFTKLEDQEQVGVKFAQAKGAASLAELRKMSWQKLTEPVPGGVTYRFNSVVDGYLLPANPIEIFAQGKQNDVAVITGCNMGEGGASPHPQTTAEQFRKQAARYQETAAEFLKLYPAVTDEEARAAQNESSWDQARTSMYLWAVNRAKTSKAKAYTYFWDHALPGPDADLYGAFHSSEVPYVMNTLSMSDRPFTAADRQIAEMMSSYWVNFVTTGNPNGKGLTHWPAVDEKAGFTMRVGDRTGPIAIAGSAEKQAWFEKYLGKSRSQSR